ncbi:SHOCT domain-containing protein [Flavobacterium sp. ZT3R25]|uniref:SHOCT domain-containing protein n=1 Tax=Flavobacterium galactosi TaxID=3398735 RepID=UPI003A860484
MLKPSPNQTVFHFPKETILCNHLIFNYKFHTFILIFNLFKKPAIHNGHPFWGIHVLWWVFWVIMLIWIFTTPYDIPGQRTKNDTALDILKKRFAKGEITKEEFDEKK